MKLFGVTEATDLIVPSATLSWDIGGAIQSGSYSNAFLSAVNSVDFEVIDARKCFDDVIHLYVFGHDLDRSMFSATVSFIVGVKCSTGGGSELKLDDVYSAYDDLRVYNRMSSVPVTVGDYSFNGFLTSLQVGTVDPSTNMCSATFNFIPDRGK